MLSSADVSKGLVHFFVWCPLRFSVHRVPRSFCPPPSTHQHIIIMDNPNNKQMHETEPTPEAFILWGKEIQNKSRRSIGSDAMEGRAFREFFGTTATVVSKIWGNLSQQGRVPIEGMAKLLLWSLYFMRAYPKQWFGGCHRPQNSPKIHLAIH